METLQHSPRPLAGWQGAWSLDAEMLPPQEEPIPTVGLRRRISALLASGEPQDKFPPSPMSMGYSVYMPKIMKIDWE